MDGLAKQGTPKCPAHDAFGPCTAEASQLREKKVTMPPAPHDFRIHEAFEKTRDRLLGERADTGVWRGRLSSSALSTATAILALNRLSGVSNAQMTLSGRQWLKSHQSASGGWGDTVKSLPNLSTTLLCWAALGGTGAEFSETVLRAERWISVEAGGLEPETLVSALKLRYGKDQTFSVPILMACALGGRLGPEPECWKLVPQLPFQLAAFPRQWFARLSLPVVSYALPALIAIGQVVHFHEPQGLGKWLRAWVQKRTLRLLEEIQPNGGGFLEATPLTSFVTMALAGMDLGEHAVAKAGADFLVRSMREDGSWPIDTDLATWGTTLSIKALGNQAEFDRAGMLKWLLSQQNQTVHSYTMSAPGGWAWTDLPGGVPDADDTSGALLAISELDAENAAVRKSAKAGVKWLLDLQNRDGGMPTFCRGWGTLPFDRSAPEITAHAIAAWNAWPKSDSRIPNARARAISFLEKTQASEGWWEPLWFGNEWANGETNRVYGTAAVVGQVLYKAAHQSGGSESFGECLSRAVTFLLKAQRKSGGWGGGSFGPESIEETGLTILALVRFSKAYPANPQSKPAIERGLIRLLELTENGTSFPPTPIGLYFARLWYFERLYPMIWTAAALREAGEAGFLFDTTDAPRIATLV